MFALTLNLTCTSLDRSGDRLVSSRCSLAWRGSAIPGLSALLLLLCR